MSSFYSNLKCIIFLCNLLWILFSQYIIYITVDNCKQKNIRILATRLSKLNILYVKLFQALSLNNNLIDVDTNNELLKFTDRVPWSSDDIDFRSLVQIGDEFNLNFVDGLENPINSGMISLVYKVTHKTSNKQMILKIKRLNIDKRLCDDVNQILYFIDFFSFLPFFKKYNVKESIYDSTDMIISQTNFKSEVDNIITFKNNCAKLDYVSIPNALREVTDEYPNAILMDFIDGKTIDKIDPTDYKTYAELVIKFGIVTSIVHGFTHGDLHMGNILFLKDENVNPPHFKIGILDFGIIYKMNRQFKDIIFELFHDFFNTEPSEIASKLLLSGLIEPIEVVKNLKPDTFNEIKEILSEIVSECINKSKKTNQVQIYKFLKGLNTWLTKNHITGLGLKPSDEFVKSQLTIAMSQGVTMKLCNEDYTPIADKVLNELFHLDMLILN